MSDLHSIKSLFNIKDENIEITEVREAVYKNRKVNLAEGTLTRIFRRCPCCKATADQLVKNGKKVSMILLNRSGNKRAYLRLKKQRYHCRTCGKYFTARKHAPAELHHIKKAFFCTIREPAYTYQSPKARLLRVQEFHKHASAYPLDQWLDQVHIKKHQRRRSFLTSMFIGDTISPI